MTVLTAMDDGAPRYFSPLRARQKAQTREMILRAVGKRLEAGGVEELSFADVAVEAKVGERTVYRHFPTKEALLGAFWTWLHQHPGEDAVRVPPITAPVEEEETRPMRILLATDAWEPQVNGVVRTLTRVVAEMRGMGHLVEVISPDQFKTFPLPTYPEIKLAVGVYEPMQERF